MRITETVESTRGATVIISLKTLAHLSYQYSYQSSIIVAILNESYYHE